MRATIAMFGAIGEQLTAAFVADEIAQFEDAGFDEMLFTFKSSGGYIEEAARIVAVVHAAQDRGLATAALIDQACNSSASWIAIACGKVWARPGATMLLHNAQIPDELDDEALAAALRIGSQWSLAMRKLYATKSGRSEGEIGRLMDGELNLDAYELLELGLVDGLVGARELPAEERA